MLNFLKTTLLILAVTLGSLNANTCRDWEGVNTEIYAETYTYIDRMIDVDAMCGTPSICSEYANAAQAYRNASYITPFPYYGNAFTEVCNMPLTTDLCKLF